MKKKKTLFIVLGIVLGLVLLYCGVWMLYRHVIWMSHIRNATEPLEKQYWDDGGQTDYTFMDPSGDGYTLSFMKFYHFGCFIQTAPALVIDDVNPEYDENGEPVYPVFNKNGSEFQITLSGTVTLKNEIPVYRANINRISEQMRTDGQIDFIFVRFTRDGELLNGDELSAEDKQLYNEAKDELMRLVRRTEEIFAF